MAGGGRSRPRPPHRGRPRRLQRARPDLATHAAATGRPPPAPTRGAWSGPRRRGDGAGPRSRRRARRLLSGGASALLPAPVPGVSLEDKAAVTSLLMRAGAGITELNTVRKHLSRLKGGGLARAAAPARVVTLVLSDVVGDDLSTIASGPTVPDPTTYADARRILDDRGITAAVPAAALRHLDAGARGELPETPKPRDPVFRRVRTRPRGQQPHQRARGGAGGAAPGPAPPGAHHAPGRRGARGRACARRRPARVCRERLPRRPPGLPSRRRRDDGDGARRRPRRPQPGDGGGGGGGARVLPGGGGDGGPGYRTEWTGRARPRGAWPTAPRRARAGPWGWLRRRRSWPPRLERFPGSPGRPHRHRTHGTNVRGPGRAARRDRRSVL
jgi:hypothetical protein